MQIRKATIFDLDDIKTLYQIVKNKQIDYNLLRYYEQCISNGYCLVLYNNSEITQDILGFVPISYEYCSEDSVHRTIVHDWYLVEELDNLDYVNKIFEYLHHEFDGLNWENNIALVFSKDRYLNCFLEVGYENHGSIRVMDSEYMHSLDYCQYYE